MANYSIRDLEKLSGIKAHTIRIWEKRYQLIQPRRTSTNIRYYSDNELKKLLNISILHRHGYRISKIAQLDNDEIHERIREITNEGCDFISQVENLVIAMIELDENKFEKILSKSIIRIGFEETIIKLVYPLFEKIGILWVTGTINPAQEHFMSNLIRQKLVSAIDGQISSDSSASKKFILFLPEGELHELGLLFYSFMLKKSGHQVIYLGQSVPFHDLIEINEIKPSDYLLTSFTSALTGKELIAYLANLSASFTDLIIFATGLQLKEIEVSLPENIIKISTPSHFFEEFERISNKIN
ncbi:MAG TPA: MerR family transcriptional regulator [Bacteroidales bacterium]|nr:MerR family transcriptional regulator [Bacteroidales bacterium]